MYVYLSQLSLSSGLDGRYGVKGCTTNNKFDELGKRLMPNNYTVTFFGYSVRFDDRLKIIWLVFPFHIRGYGSVDNNETGLGWFRGFH